MPLLVTGPETIEPVLPPLDPTRDYPMNVLAQYPDDQRRDYFRARARLQQIQGRPAGEPSINKNDSRPGDVGSETYADAASRFAAGGGI